MANVTLILAKLEWLHFNQYLRLCVGNYDTDKLDHCETDTVLLIYNFQCSALEAALYIYVKTKQKSLNVLFKQCSNQFTSHNNHI